MVAMEDGATSNQKLEEITKMAVKTNANKEDEPVEEDDEHDCKERVLQKYFLQEWNVVKSILDDIVSLGRVSNISSAYKIRHIVLFFLYHLSVFLYKVWFLIITFWLTSWFRLIFVVRT